MSYKSIFNCRKYSLLAAFMLLFQFSDAQDKFSKLDDWLSSNVTKLGGRAVLVIYKDGHIIYNHAENGLSRKQKFIGKIIAKRSGKDPENILQDFDSATKERIASCSKWLSAALVMTFVDEGKLSLEDSVGKFLPVMSQNGKGHIRIWQCLSHLTGINSGTLKESLHAMKNINSMDEAIEMIAKQPMEGEPGKTFHYSNTGLQIAGAVIEKISGKNFETLFTERIAAPCKMTHTDFGNKNVSLPAGGAWSTAEDYIRFLTMLLNDGIYDGETILSKKSIIEMQKNRLTKETEIRYTPAAATQWGYGFGEWTMDNATGDMKSNAVTSPGLFGSFPWIDYNKNYAAFLMTFDLNNKGRNELYRELKEITDGITSE